MKFWPVSEKVDMAETGVMKACGFGSLLCFHKVKYKMKSLTVRGLPFASPLLKQMPVQPGSNPSLMHHRAHVSFGAQALSREANHKEIPHASMSSGPNLKH